MLKMIPQIDFFLLAIAILLSTGWGHAMAPRPFDQSIGMMADKYGTMETMNSGTLQVFIVI